MNITNESLKQNNLKKYRLQCGLTQKQVAEKLGLDCENRLSRWEKGLATPSVINLLRICAIYKVNPAEIFFDAV